MIELFLRVLVGFVVGAGITYIVYKKINKKTIKEAIQEKKINESELFKNAFKAKVKEKNEKEQTVTVDILDKFDCPIAELKIKGDAISGELSEGTIILV